MRAALFVSIAALAGCNHDAPSAGPGSGSAPTSQPEVPIALDAAPAAEPPVTTLPGAGLPGGLRGEPKSGAATLSDLGVDATWPDDLRPRWLSAQALLVSLQRRPVMLAKLAAPTEGLVDGKPLIKTDAGQTTVTCERTLRAATYHLEASNVDADTADAIAKLCTALR